MNVVNGDKFYKKHSIANNRKRLHPPTKLVGGNVNGHSSAAQNPRYAFDGLVARSGWQNNSCQSTVAKGSAMGPPQFPYPASRKRGNTSSASVYQIDSISSGGIASKEKLSVRKTTSCCDSAKGMTTPKYVQNVRPVSSSTSRGHGGSRTTPGSSTSNNTMPASCIILAISEGRGNARGEVGMAAVDLRRPHLVLCQFSDSHSYIHSLTKIHYFNPVEIIVPHTFNSGVVDTELYRLIKDQFPSIRLTSVQRRHFSDSAGFQQIQSLCAPEYSSVELQLMHKFYALTSAAAVMKYVEYIQCVTFAPCSLKIEYIGSQHSTMIDVETAIRLELVESLSGAAGRGGSLLSILNHTYTAGGLRNLRANILQPTCNPQVINTRLDCIAQLLDNNEGLLPALQSVMKQLYDVDKILWLCMVFPNPDASKAGEAQLNHTLQLKTTTDLVPDLIAALGKAKGKWFADAKLALENPKFIEITERIKRVLQDNAHAGRGALAHHNRCFAVKPEINGLLDVARRSYSEIITDIQEKVGQLAETYSLPLRLVSNASRGFHIVISIGVRNRRGFNIGDLPPIFLEVQNHGSSISMTTEELIILDQQARESLIEIQNMSNIVIYGLLTELRPYIGVLYKLCEIVAELDVILSLTQVSSAGNYIRPLFNDYLELKDSIHPMLDYVIPTTPTGNDVFSSPEYNFHIITGPNMGGKTIYIKQIALLQIMAQIGCFVPATRAVFRIADHVFSRIGFNDSIECNASTYVLEMKEVHYILQTMTPTSLIIIDELCRGTSSEEGASMAWAVCEQLLDSEAFTFFTSHFLYLTKLQDLYYNVVNLHTKAEEIQSSTSGGDNKLIYKHKIEPGVTTIEQYGLTLAKNTNIPRSVIDLAEDLSKIIIKQRKPRTAIQLKETEDVLLYKLAADLMQESRHPNANDDRLNDIITKFKENHPEVIQNITSKRSCSSANSSFDTSGENINLQRRRKVSTSSEKTSDGANGNKKVINKRVISTSSTLSSIMVASDIEKISTEDIENPEACQDIESFTVSDKRSTDRLPRSTDEVEDFQSFDRYNNNNPCSSNINTSVNKYESEDHFNFAPQLTNIIASQKEIDNKTGDIVCHTDEYCTNKSNRKYYGPPVIVLRRDISNDKLASQSSVNEKLTALFGETGECIRHDSPEPMDTEELLDQLADSFDGAQRFNPFGLVQKKDDEKVYTARSSIARKHATESERSASSQSSVNNSSHYETCISSFDDGEGLFNFKQFVEDAAMTP